MSKKHYRTILFFVSVIVLFCGFFFNLPLKTTQFGVDDFDWWANDIMIADLSYRQFYGA